MTRHNGASLGSRQPYRSDQRDPDLALTELFDPVIARQLWESLPVECRSDHFGKATMPDAYRDAIIPASSGNGQRTTLYLNMRELPETMIWELAWVLHREIGLGRRVHPVTFNAGTRGLRVAVAHGGRRARSAASLMSLTAEQWVHEAQVARLKGAGAGPSNDEYLGQAVKRWQDLLVYSYHRGDWWRLNVWNPVLDARIPLRPHEPKGTSIVNFSRLHTDWLREAVKWWMSLQLETQQMSWSTVTGRVHYMNWLQKRIDIEGDLGPALVEDDTQLRAYMRRLAEDLRTHRAVSGRNVGEQVGIHSRQNAMVTIERFYQWMFDNQHEAAATLDEPRWASLTGHYAKVFRPGEKPRLRLGFNDELVLEDDVVTKILAGADLLATPVSEGGLGDVQAFHALMLLIRTGRRINEVLLMDYDPLLPLVGAPAEGRQGFVARLRYQQTKVITDQPATIPVDEEIVAIVRAQQAFACQFMTEQGEPAREPRYLFIRTSNNRLGRQPYSSETMHVRLRKLTELLKITNSVGQPVRISRTHSFRHTRATNLLNAGVPIHVVMRHFGHLTPTMTMHYAKTLAQTAEREFLRFKKVTADGRALELSPEDLYDVLKLDQRADRVLPNGWCLLPPKQSCSRGNACLTCPQFTTDETHHDELARQLQETDALIISRRRAFTARFGTDMPDNNVWLDGRRQERDALQRVLIALDQVKLRPGAAVRGAGDPDLPVEHEQPKQPE
jgi:integrase